MANKFEERLNNLPYSTDWAERKDMMLRLIYSMYNEFDRFAIYWTSLNKKEETRFRFIFFTFEDDCYVWTDVVENGLVEGYVLDKLIAERLATNLASNIANQPPFAPIAIGWLKEDKLYRDYNAEEIIENQDF